MIINRSLLFDIKSNGTVKDMTRIDTAGPHRIFSPRCIKMRFVFSIVSKSRYGLSHCKTLSSYPIHPCIVMRSSLLFDLLIIFLCLMNYSYGSTIIFFLSLTILINDEILVINRIHNYLSQLERKCS